jgi:hypothetical protein
LPLGAVRPWNLLPDSPYRNGSARPPAKPRNSCCGRKIRAPFSHIDGNDKLNRIALGASGAAVPLRRKSSSRGGAFHRRGEKERRALLGARFAASRPNCWPHNDGLISGERRMKLW